MATNYTPPQFEGGFQRSAQSLGFNPEAAIDTSSQEEKKLRKVMEDDEVRARSLQRQQSLDEGMLRGRQTFERAQQSYDQAGERGNLALIKGLAGFSTTLANTLVDESKKAEQRAEEAAIEAEEDAMMSSYGLGPLSDDTLKGIEEQQQIDMQITAEAQGIGEVSQELSAAGDDGTAKQLTDSSLYAQDGPQRRSLAQAEAMYGGWILDQVSQIDTTGMSDSQIQAEVLKLNKIFASGIKRSKGDRRSALKLAKTMNGYSANAYQTLFKTRREGIEAAQEAQLKDTIALAANNEVPGQAFNEVFAEISNDPLFRGDRGTAKREALSSLTAQYSALGRPDLIRELMTVDPGTGTRFGDDATLTVMFKEALIKANSAAQADYTAQTQEEAREIAEIVTVFQKDMSAAARKKAISQLEAINSNASLEQARNLMSGGMLYDEDLSYKV